MKTEKDPYHFSAPSNPSGHPQSPRTTNLLPPSFPSPSTIPRAKVIRTHSSYQPLLPQHSVLAVISHLLDNVTQQGSSPVML